jgi:prepilin-type N-terminal cleavage/methylation domain-containing protein
MCSSPGSAVRHAYTLIEILVVVTIMGIAGMVVLPALGQSNVLRVQGAIRSVVADITFAQSDALAYQEERAIVFDAAENCYTLVEVQGDAIDAVNNAIFSPQGPDQRYVVDFDDPKWGGIQLADPTFGDDPILIFDELGGPIIAPGSDEPGTGGSVDVIGTDARFRVTVEPFTGHVTVAEVALDGTPLGE